MESSNLSNRRFHFVCWAERRETLRMYLCTTRRGKIDAMSSMRLPLVKVVDGVVAAVTASRAASGGRYIKDYNFRINWVTRLLLASLLACLLAYSFARSTRRTPSSQQCSFFFLSLSLSFSLSLSLSLLLFSRRRSENPSRTRPNPENPPPDRLHVPGPQKSRLCVLSWQARRQADRQAPLSRFVSTPFGLKNICSVFVFGVRPIENSHIYSSYQLPCHGPGDRAVPCNLNVCFF